ncbi:hypothetical protein SLINC_0063 [Streptomyces lincolnensis]|uniref:Uncharacterized protein n=1 Tax=Streptomyces lincolnensis TaxID=1915 RepID=A0A1B1M1I1_STRLN|nr:hypothetical protein [Streptomyces lincolnensis]ANS62287.1 hypothetical protein SLINC_0063 [Streptomyces lincolnensis]AXG51217.1 hypothetical protein SLCG_0062 [Streptomyces lincolnensis]QMV04297.1 hypothetical protein GJU35_00350 [Streptomyces lincolnensis]QMV12026.1 hypothetical protein GJU35_44570 [Streptomyces lincolnensis]
MSQPEVELLSVTDVTGHEIENDVWYTANAQWLLYGLAVDEVEAPVGYIACVWSMKVLFSARDDEAPTLLTSEEPSPPDTGDESCMRIAQRLARKMVADQLALIDNPVQRLAQQMAASMPKLDIAADLHLPGGPDEAIDEVEQSDSSGASEARAGGTDDEPADGDRIGE